MSSASVYRAARPPPLRTLGRSPPPSRAAAAAVLFVVFSSLLVLTWTRLAVERAGTEDLLHIVGLAALPVVVALLVRGRFAPLAWVFVTTCVGLVALADAFGLSLADLWPADAWRDFFSPLWERFELGLRGYYETRVTFDPVAHPEMESIVLVAIFGFAAMAGSLAAAGWLLPAGVVLLIGVGWPATLRATVGGNSLAVGALMLASLLLVLYVARRQRRTTLSGTAQAAVLAAALVLAGVSAATSNLVAKPAALDWQSWTPYAELRESVGVRYVWNTSYSGIRWPENETVVLTVSGVPEGSYWRATTLDEYNGFGWLESHEPEPVEAGQQQLDVGNLLLPPEAAIQANWVEQEITVGGLADDHLIAAPQPIRWRVGADTAVEVAEGGVVFLPAGLERDQTYTVWSFAPDVTPGDLIDLAADYPVELDRYIEGVPGIGALPFGTLGRARRMETFFEMHPDAAFVQQHRPLYEQALNVVGDAPSPYAAAIGLEQWFRNTGGFTYDELPPTPSGDQPPLSEFVLVDKRGYCQQYAGSMALMLRLLGIPSRVAAGFVPGDYDETLDQWTVTDRDAHTWVEVWFPGFGWLPFDPTPARGELADSYSASSTSFLLDEEQAGSTSDVLAASPGLAALFADQLAALNQNRPETGTAAALASPAAGDSGAGSRAPVYVIALLALLGAVAAVVVMPVLWRRARLLGKSGREIATAARRDLELFLADQGDIPGASFTVGELAEHVSRRYGVDASRFAGAVTLARFGEPPQAAAAAQTARREQRLLIRALRKRISASRRLRGLLHIGGIRLSLRRRHPPRPA